MVCFLAHDAHEAAMVQCDVDESWGGVIRDKSNLETAPMLRPVNFNTPGLLSTGVVTK